MIDSSLASLVRDRAGNRCEYWLRQEDDPFFRFHIEHIIPRQHSGRDESENLALACHHAIFTKAPTSPGLIRKRMQSRRCFTRAARVGTNTLGFAEWDRRKNSDRPGHDRSSEYQFSTTAGFTGAAVGERPMAVASKI